MSASFVHLHLHTEFSLRDSVVRIPALIERARALGMPAVAVTDHCNVFALVKFYRAALNAGIKPIIGADLPVVDPERSEAESVVTVLCCDNDGYRNLARLLTRAYREGQVRGTPRVVRDWLTTEALRGLLMIAGHTSDIAQAGLAGDGDAAAALAEDWSLRLPGNLFLGLTRTGREAEGALNGVLLQVAERLDLPVVATNDVRFVDRDDFNAHEARVCIHGGRTLRDPRRPRRYSDEQYLRDADEMAEIFADLPEALENGLVVAQRCNLDLRFGEYQMPEFPVAAGQSPDIILRERCAEGLNDRLAATEAGRPRQVYLDRLTEEIDVIAKMGFASYFLIVADFIRWAKEHDIPVGPGRGSGAGSLAAYALGITEIDPLDYDLLFERFLNPQRVSMPDFDVDFCMDRRDEVIEYVARLYGRERVAQIITFGTMAAKAVLRDVGRVMGFPFGFVDQLAKLVPFDPSMTLTRALKEEPALKRRYDEEDDVREMFDLALRLEGLARNAGKHAGGVVIAPRELTEFMPLYCEQGSDSAVTQLDMGDVETMGLVKFDFLGLRTLTIVDWAVKGINARRAAAGEAAVDVLRLPLDDQSAFKLVQEAQTTAVFQLESRGIKELIKRLRPDSFEDMVALVALYRPGPLQSGMVDDFIDRKHGRAQVHYPHPLLEGVLRPTYGVILYQEQVMQIAQILAGYSLGDADLLRRAMGKKKAEEMAHQREIFVAGAVARGVDQPVAAQIFDLMEKFAGYGFNKSHSAAYALIAYQTAWLKAHYPADFMAAVLSADMDTTDKVVRLIEECRQLGIAVVPPDVNHCDYQFTVEDKVTIRYGLGAVKGLGESAIGAIVASRCELGAYSDIFDLCRRDTDRRLNRRALDALIRAGALDCLGVSRRGLTELVDAALQGAEQAARAAAMGQTDLFGISAVGHDSADCPEEWTRALALPEWSERERLAAEKETLGLYLTGHPIDEFESDIARISSCRLVNARPGKRRIAGLIVSVRMFKGRRGPMAIVTVDDKTARVDVTVYSELLADATSRLVADRICVFEGECAIDDFSGNPALVAERVMSLEEARNRYARALVIRVDAEEGRAVRPLEGLQACLQRARGQACGVAVEVGIACARTRLRLGSQWQVDLSDALLTELRDRFGGDSVWVEYEGRRVDGPAGVDPGTASRPAVEYAQ